MFTKTTLCSVLLSLVASNCYAAILSIEPLGRSQYNFPANSGALKPVRFIFTVKNNFNQNVYLTDVSIVNDSPLPHLYYSPNESTCSLYKKEGASTKPLLPNKTCTVIFNASVPNAVGDYSHNQFIMETQLSYNVASGYFGIKVS